MPAGWPRDEIGELRPIPSGHPVETEDEGAEARDDCGRRPRAVEERLDGQEEDGRRGEHEMMQLDHRREQQTCDQIGENGQTLRRRSLDCAAAHSMASSAPSTASPQTALRQINGTLGRKHAKAALKTEMRRLFGIDWLTNGQTNMSK